jgi:uncharacterized protein with ParB-like and HNH nuclease domain
MPNDNEIKSEKILVKDVFSTMWFRIPEYQRPYIWSSDQVNGIAPGKAILFLAA